MRIAVTLLFVFVLAISPAALAAASSSSVRDDGRFAKPGVASSVFRADGELLFPKGTRLSERLPAGATRVAISSSFIAGARPPGSASGRAASWGRRNIAVAMLASAILPGMGELYCYRVSRDPWTLARVPAFLAADGYLWYSYLDNRSTGKDFKREYETFADSHWSLDRFLHNHPCCSAGVGDSCDSWQDYNDRCKNQFPYFFYTPRESDREEYYENIGKYNAFVFGWDDCVITDTSDPNFTYWTKNRTDYVALRNESDRYLLRADQRIMWLIVNRVVSMLDAGWLAYRLSKGENPDDGWSLRFRTYQDAPTVLIDRRF